MRRDLHGAALPLIGVIAVPLAFCMPAAAQQATTTPDESAIDVNQLFASTCGFCHSDGGRTPGKGPQLMDSKRSDDFIRDRIKTGKTGAMPAFGDAFSDEDLDAIVKYVRSLTPSQG